MTKETAVLEALRSEQARMETMRIIQQHKGGKSWQIM